MDLEKKDIQIKRNMLRWFSHMERKKREEFMKKVYICEERKASYNHPVI